MNPYVWISLFKFEFLFLIVSADVDGVQGSSCSLSNSEI